MLTQLPSALSEMQKLPSGQDQCAVALRIFAPSKGRPIRLHDNKCFTDDDGGRNDDSVIQGMASAFIEWI